VGKLVGLEMAKVERILREYELGHVTCQKCGDVMNFSPCVRLSMTKCPKCGDLVFVPLKVDDWWTMEPVGAGGFGSIYLGRTLKDPKLKAAIKVMQRSEHIDQGVIDRFMREAEISYSFDPHPHLVETYAYGQMDDGTPFMIMEFMDGERLNEYITVREQIPPEECLYYMLDLVSALEYIWNVGYVYRDMKPENVIIKKDGLAAILDFGLCMKREEAAISSETTQIVGSALFMPPERCFRMGEDCRGDMYSLGMVLYYALLGDSFFSRTEVRTAVRAHTMKLRIQTNSRMQGFDESLVDLVDKMIRRDRDERYKSYDELRQAIFTVLAHYQQDKTRDPVILKRRRHFLDNYGELKYE
jgi:eukaryotic-like serine/threonine-protein kinase